MLASDGRPAATRARNRTRGEPECSPGGKRIAFAAAGDIWVMRVNGHASGEPDPGPTSETAVAWSPDGK